MPGCSFFIVKSTDTFSPVRCVNECVKSLVSQTSVAQQLANVYLKGRPPILWPAILSCLYDQSSNTYKHYFDAFLFSGMQWQVAFMLISMQTAL